MSNSFTYIIISIALAFTVAPIIIDFLYKKKIVRHTESDFAAIIPSVQRKTGTPIMGGLIFLIPIILLSGGVILKYSNSAVNLESEGGLDFIKQDVGPVFAILVVTVVSALLGGIDDVLNIFGKKRAVRTVAKQIRLAKVHKDKLMRIRLWLTLPITAYKNVWYAMGSYPGKGVHAGEKILVQLLVGCSVAWDVIVNRGMETMWFPWFGPFGLGILGVGLIVVAIMGMMNAVNFTDGMDGLAAGVSIPPFLGFMFLAIVKGQSEIALLSAMVVGGLLVYLYFNIKPARVQMGDVGSLALGALLACIAIYLDLVVLLPVIGFVFVIETVSSIWQSVFRRLAGRRFFKMAPIHYHLLLIGWSEEKVVMRFWLFSIIFTVVGVWLALL